MAKTINLIRYANAKLVSADINTLGVTFAAQSPYRADGFLKVNVTVANANPTQKMFLEGADFTIYAIGGNVTKLSAYSLSMFKKLEQVWLFSSTMVEIEETDNNAYLDYLKPSCVIYVPSNLITNYQTTYSNLSSKFVPINLDYTLTIIGSGTLTSEIITDQLMNGTYNAQDREACTKLVISGFDNYMDTLWGYNLSAVLPNFNNNVWYNATEIDFTTRELEGIDELLESDITNLINGISSDKLSGVTQLKFSGFSDMSVALTYDYSDLPNLAYVWLDNVRYNQPYANQGIILYDYVENLGADNNSRPKTLNTGVLFIPTTKHKMVIDMRRTAGEDSWLNFISGVCSLKARGIPSGFVNVELANVTPTQYINIFGYFNVRKLTECYVESGNSNVNANGTLIQFTETFNYPTTTPYVLYPSTYQLRTWKFQVYDDNDVLRINLLPCYNKNTQKFGMFDTISETTLYTETGDLSGGTIQWNAVYFYSLSSLEQEYDARLTQTFYLDYNGTFPTLSSDFTYTWYSDINCTTSILPENMQSGTRYYAKAVMVTLTIRGSGTLTSAIVEPQVAKAGSGVTKVVVPVEFTSYDTQAFTLLLNELSNVDEINSPWFKGDTTNGFEYTLEPDVSATLSSAFIDTQLSKISAIGLTVNSMVIPSYFSTVNGNQLGSLHNTGITKLTLKGQINIGAFTSLYDNSSNIKFDFVDIVIDDYRGTTLSTLFGYNSYNNLQVFKSLTIQNSTTLTTLDKVFSSMGVSGFSLEIKNCPNLSNVSIAQMALFSNMQKLAIDDCSSINTATSIISNCNFNFVGTNLKLNGILTDTIFSAFTTWGWSVDISYDALIDLINSLGTPATQQTLTIGATNLAKLTADDVAIATQKNWLIQ